MSEDPVADYNQITTELALYDEKLAEKPEIVVFNKMDIPTAQEYFPLAKEALAERGVDLLPISAATQMNIQELIQKTFEAVSQLPVEEDAYALEEVPTYELEEDAPTFVLEKLDDETFKVTGKRIERAAAMTYWDYEEAVVRFQKILEILGISQALKEAGVQPGHTVFIGSHELEWSD